MVGSVVGCDHAWERTLELAWDAFCAGTTPVGAVVIDAAGAIVAEGRGRRYEPAAPPGQLAGSHVAHADAPANPAPDLRGLPTPIQGCPEPESVIVSSFGRYLPRTAHDHETAQNPRRHGHRGWWRRSYSA